MSRGQTYVVLYITLRYVTLHFYFIVCYFILYYIIHIVMRIDVRYGTRTIEDRISDSPSLPAGYRS